MKNWLPLFFLLFSMTGCSGETDPPTVFKEPPTNQDPEETPAMYKYLALGDSYTIGQSVCETCRFPEQLKVQLQSAKNGMVSLDIIATTGWTTTNLIHAINTQNPAQDYDLVTLLIGVNNQYQHKPFSVYEQEFPQLIGKAIAAAKGDRSRLVVVSIPDYAYTPFGQSTGNADTISAEIDQYNAFARNYCAAQNIVFVNITDITRNGLAEPSLVASDGLHPSQSAYALFVERLLPKAMVALAHP